MSEFRLFYDVAMNAVFTDKPCEEGHLPPFLDAEYFDGGYEDEGVCLECLRSGSKKVSMNTYIKAKIKICAGESAALIINELEQTPPVPWIQYNDWPLCCGDAMQYRGEHSRQSIFIDDELKGFPDNLWIIADEHTRKQAVDHGSLEASIRRGMTVCFIFRCMKCGRYQAVCQSY
jgi:uncharacterized protein CbrC (UPF0167 family)